MDSITQIALGAVIGQAIGYKKLGNKALVMGGFAALIPDFDVFITPVAEFFGHHDEFMGWKYHRHFSHALWFGPLLGTLMGWGLWRHYERQTGHLAPWITILVLAILTHPLLDTCTIYGTQLLAPFSTHRFYISSVSIIDPIYTVPLFISLLLVSFKKFRAAGEKIARTVLILTTAFLAYGWHLNFKAESLARTQLAGQKIVYDRLNAYTTIFQPFLRRVVVWQPDEILRVGFVSTFSPSPIMWTCGQQAPLDIREKVLMTEEGRITNWFSIETLSIMEDETSQRIIATDAKYGVPGPSIFGWWGIEFLKNADGSLQYVGRTWVERGASWEVIRELFKASYGLPNNFLPKEDTGCSNPPVRTMY